MHKATEILTITSGQDKARPHFDLPRVHWADARRPNAPVVFFTAQLSRADFSQPTRLLPHAPRTDMPSTTHPVWDLPTRIFHWLLASGIAAAWATYELGWMAWHARAGYVVLGLILFRLGWGVFGSAHSRFADFVRGPRAVKAYFQGKGAPYIGHNPAGGWSVLVLLSLVLFQAVTGLFNADDAYFNGPFNPLVSSAVADTLGGLHELGFNVLLTFIALHVLAVLWSVYKGDPILRAMLSGRHAHKSGDRPPVSLWRALLWGAVSAGAIWWLLQQAPKPEALFF